MILATASETVLGSHLSSRATAEPGVATSAKMVRDDQRQPPNPSPKLRGPVFHSARAATSTADIICSTLSSIAENMPPVPPQEMATAAHNKLPSYEKLTRSNYNLHGRCLVLFSELTVAKTRISELEGVVSAMRYAFKYVDLEQCTLCEMDEDFSDA